MGRSGGRAFYEEQQMQRSWGRIQGGPPRHQKEDQAGWGMGGAGNVNRQGPDHIGPCCVLLGLEPALTGLCSPHLS